MPIDVCATQEEKITLIETSSNQNTLEVGFLKNISFWSAKS
jgi:hypothetical protein